MTVKKTKHTVDSATNFFTQMLKETHKDITPLKSNSSKTGVYISKDDELYEWAKNG